MQSHIHNFIVRPLLLAICTAAVPSLAIAAGDFNEDGKVNGDDLVILNEQIEGGQHNPSFDLNGDGRVDNDDLALLRQDVGDFNDDGLVDVHDANVLLEVVASEAHDPHFDLTNDGLVDKLDILQWTHEKANTWIGDANFDGEFNSGDVVQIF